MFQTEPRSKSHIMTVRVHECDHESAFRKYLKVIKFATAWIENASAEKGLKQGRRSGGRRAIPKDYVTEA